MTNAIDITIWLPRCTQRYRPGNEGYPPPPEWIYLDVRRRGVGASSLPAGCSADQRPAWMSECVELLALRPNLASLAPIREALERSRKDLAMIVDDVESGTRLDDTALFELQDRLEDAMQQCPRMADFGEAIEDGWVELIDLVAKESVAEYVRYFDGGDLVVDPEDVQMGIIHVVRTLSDAAEDDPDALADRERSLLAKAREIVAAEGWAV